MLPKRLRPFLPSLLPRRGALSCVLSGLLALAGCGGGEDPAGAGSDAATSRSHEVREQAAAARPAAMPATIPADAASKGAWSSIYAWPLIPIHMLLLPDGRLLSYGTKGDGTQTGYFDYDVWDGSTRPDLEAGHLTMANATATDIFCNTQLLLPNQNGLVFQAGGDNWTGTSTTNTGNNNTTYFNNATNALTRGGNMYRARWYATATTLINGETYIQGGASGTDRAEVRQLDGTFRLLSAASTAPLDYYYPRNFVAPDGRIFGYDTNGIMYYMNPTGTGALRDLAGASTITADAGADNASPRLDTQYTGFASSAAMYRPGRILQIGGTRSSAAAVIDITSGTPTVTPTGSLSQQRAWVNATLLPNGKVLGTGGSPIANWYGGANNLAEIWDPQTGVWTQGSAGGVARMYHSTAMLLPDASVLVGGGGAPGPLTNTNVEVYYPPYFFTAGGALADRPEITSAPTVLNLGKTFTVTVDDGRAVQRVTLIKTGSVTHSFNVEQRFLELNHQVSGNTVTIQAPTRAADATPGYYLLFVSDASGVPSVGKILKLNISSDPDPDVTPTLTNPGAQSDLQSVAASLTLSGRDPNGDTLRYSAVGLPPGLSLDSASGSISGTPTMLGTFDVVASVSDGINAGSVSFSWTITAPDPLALTSVGAPGTSVSGSTVSYTAEATGLNPRYKWNFGDGTGDTDWSASGTTTHRYASAGLYYVTLTINDDRGIPQTRSFLQTIYLPLTAQRPTASSSVVYESPASGSARVWVLNPDNGSVTAFDATTRARLGSVSTGTAPRSLAIAPDGRLWVVNRGSATISVLDTASRTLVSTIKLPRGSQPYGIAMSPVANLAYVALEGTGQVLRFDTTTGTQTGAASVGANPRHLSVTADGASVYVSRYITPPMPGEGTAVVDVSGNVGGEVVKLTAATMTVARKIVLRHSDRPDFENQGRGIPNYLAAAVISPDGTQAWVPSKQDNILRGTLRDGNALNFQSTVRAVSSRIVLATDSEDLERRIDHDNASVASAAAYDAKGVYLFVALETSREIAVINAHTGQQLLRVDTGRAPQGLTLSADGKTLYVHNYMDRTLGVYDLQPLVVRGETSLPLLAALPTVDRDKLSATVLLGKQLFYDARDPRLARDRYMSCASCHNDGGQDGRVWDLTSQGEGLRNTIALRGRAGMAQGYLHWSANFDEVQDFEGQIRTLAGGTGLMGDTDFATGTRSKPLGAPKAGVSADLDALAAYVGSLGSFDPSPLRPDAATLSAAATTGKALFESLDCAACHAGKAYTGSGATVGLDIGTLKPSSGTRLGKTLAGIDVPTLRDVWATAPYLHDGSAATLSEAVRAHEGLSLSSSKLRSLVAYLKEIGSDESAAPQAEGSGTGLLASYYNNVTFSGTPVLTKTQTVNANWGSKRPSAKLTASGFSVRWTGTIQAPSTGVYVLRTVSDGGVRVRLSGKDRIDNWTAHGSSTDDSAPIKLVAGKRYSLRVDFYNSTASAKIKLQWITPGNTTAATVPADRLFTP